MQTLQIVPAPTGITGHFFSICKDQAGFGCLYACPQGQFAPIWLRESQCFVDNLEAFSLYQQLTITDQQQAEMPRAQRGWQLAYSLFEHYRCMLLLNVNNTVRAAVVRGLQMRSLSHGIVLPWLKPAKACSADFLNEQIRHDLLLEQLASAGITASELSHSNLSVGF
jgi:hypothetical protein